MTNVKFFPLVTTSNLFLLETVQNGTLPTLCSTGKTRIPADLASHILRKSNCAL